MPRACAVADRVYKNPTRKGSILVNAMKKVAQEMELHMSSPFVFSAASVVAHVVYMICYKGSTTNVYELARECYPELNAQGVDINVLCRIARSEDELMDIALDAIKARGDEYKPETIGKDIAFAILAKTW